MIVPDFNIAFAGDGQRYLSYLGELTFHVQHAGNLVTPTGQIVACDPFVPAIDTPFTVKAPPGSYPVLLSIAHIETDQRVACALVKFAEAVPTSWRMALVAGQREEDLEDGEIFGYPVDSATGCFMDVSAACELLERSNDSEAYVEEIEEIMEKMHTTYVPTWSWINVEMNSRTGTNLVAFSSGQGDGHYASYFGYSGDDNLVCLLTDFGLLDEPSPDPRQAPRPWWEFWKKAHINS